MNEIIEGSSTVIKELIDIVNDRSSRKNKKKNVIASAKQFTSDIEKMIIPDNDCVICQYELKEEEPENHKLMSFKQKYQSE